MRLCDVLSKSPQANYIQVDGFLTNKKGTAGQKVDLSVGKIALNYFCTKCDDVRTFYSEGTLSCIFDSKHMVSIDSILRCGCGATVQTWFLVESEQDITSASPKIRILKRSEKLSPLVHINTNRYGNIAMLLDKAEQAYRDELGAGSIIYLRKIFEIVTVQMADAMNIDYPKHEAGNPKNFSALLQKVDTECKIIPPEFSSNGYKLFRELSTVVHGASDEDECLRKFEPLHRLVIGILENITNKKELKAAMQTLGWECATEGDRE